jgi:hypothetical protein
MQSISVTVLLMPFLVPSVAAQGWSITADAPVPATALAGGFPGISNTRPAGPVAPGQIISQAASGSGWSASAGASWAASIAGQTAPLAFAVNCFANSSTTQQPYIAASVSVTLDLTLHMPQTVGGRLVVTGTWGSVGVGGNNTLGLDVGGDGVVEFTNSTTNLLAMPIDVPVPSGVNLIRLTFQAGYLVISPDNGGTGLSLQAQFYPNEPAVHAFDTTGAGTMLSVDHTTGNSVTIGLSTALQTPVLLAFGFDSLVAPLAPGVTLLVTPDVIFPVGSMTLSLPPLPPGTTLFCQGLVMQFGAYRSSNSVRAIWP